MTRMRGIVVPTVTPFTEDDRIDFEAIGRLVDYLVAKGVHGLYPCGSAGEMLKMTVNERKAVAEETVRASDGRVPVFVHVGAATTKDTVELAEHAVEIGSQGIGVVTPQYFTVNDRELIEFFSAVASSVPEDFPVYLYALPQCAVNDIPPRIIPELRAKAPNIVGIKYSWTDFVRIKDFLRFDGFDVIIGLDRFILPGLSMGCKGTVSGCSQAFPDPFVAQFNAFERGDLETARKEFFKSTELCEIVKAGGNTAYFKSALKLNGVIESHMRAPGLDLTDEEEKALEADLSAFKKRYGYMG